MPEIEIKLSLKMTKAQMFNYMKKLEKNNLQFSNANKDLNITLRTQKKLIDTLCEDISKGTDKYNSSDAAFKAAEQELLEALEVNRKQAQELRLAQTTNRAVRAENSAVLRANADLAKAIRILSEELE